MAYEIRPNTGSLFRNDKKETDSHPSYKGSGLIGGVEYFLDAWVNEAKDGSKYMSLKFKPKEARTQQPASQGYAPADLDDDPSVPF